MSSILRSLVLITLLAGCSFSGGNSNPPRNLDNACSILDQRRSFLPAFRAAKRKYGVPISTQMAIIWQESKFKANARTPKKYILWVIPAGRQSSAYGYAQALDGTWKEYKKSAGRCRFHGLVYGAKPPISGHSDVRHAQPISRLPRRPDRLSPRIIQIQTLAD